MGSALDILPGAIADITAAARWHENQRGGLGTKFALEVNETIETAYPA